MPVSLLDQYLTIEPTPTPTFVVHVRHHPRQFSKGFGSAETLIRLSATGYAYLQDDDGPPPDCIYPPCEGPQCAASYLALCPPSSSGHRPPTGIPTFTPVPTSDTGYPPGTSSSTSSTSASESTPSTTSVTSSAPSSGTSIPAIVPSMHDRDDQLTAEQIAGIALGGVLGLLFVGVFLWLLRRGTFGSGTLCGFRYGNARRAGWRPGLETGSVQAEMSQTGKGTGSAGNLANPFESGTSLPSGPSSTLAASAASLYIISDEKLQQALYSFPGMSRPLVPLPPPRSPAVWSTSTSAFDNAYGSVVAPSTARPSTAGSWARPSTSGSWAARPSTSGSWARSTRSDGARSLSLSRVSVSTLFSGSGRMRTSISTLTSAYIPRTSASTPAPAVDVQRYLSSGVQAQVDSAPPTETRTPSPAPTLSAESTIEGARISSWHSSDSEETELIVRAPPRR